jgi:3-phenylpropionate/trans-cinnamate dioxygenase ferredoxin subunit
MAEFVSVARVGDLPDPGKMLLEVEDRMLVLLLVDGNYYCIDDVCTHDGGPLGEGELCQFALACPRHGAKFDIRTGQALTMPATEATVAHEVAVRDNQVWVRLRQS